MLPVQHYRKIYLERWSKASGLGKTRCKYALLNNCLQQISTNPFPNEPNVSYYSRLERVIVSYDTKKNSWHCACTKSTRSCTHKYIAKWHLFQTSRSLFRKVRSTDVEECLHTPPPADEHCEEDNASYPPCDDEKLKVMVQYILKSKRIPAVLPDHVLHPGNKTYPSKIFILLIFSVKYQL